MLFLLYGATAPKTSIDPAPRHAKHVESCDWKNRPECSVNQKSSLLACIVRPKRWSHRRRSKDLYHSAGFLISFIYPGQDSGFFTWVGGIKVPGYTNYDRKIYEAENDPKPLPSYWTEGGLR